MLRPVALTLSALLVLTACGSRAARTNMRSVIGPGGSYTIVSASSPARSAAQDMGRQLGSGSWTYYGWGGALKMPADFKAAATDLGSAWSSAAYVFPGDQSLRTLLRSDAGNRAIAVEALAEPHRARAAAIRQIDAAHARLVEVAAKYGFTVPDSWVAG